MIVISTTCLGITWSKRLVSRADFFEQLIGFVTSLKTEIRYNSDIITNILSKSAGTLIKPLTEAAVQRVYGGLAFADAWSQSVQNLPACLGITQEDKALIVQFGTGLGSSDTDGQILHCTMYQEFFKERLKAAKDEKDKKVKLYRSLGAFGGIALALFII